MRQLKLICLLALSLALASCEKVSLDELLSKEPPTSQPSSTGNASLSIHIGGIADANYQDATAKGTRAIEAMYVQNLLYLFTTKKVKEYTR